MSLPVILVVDDDATVLAALAADLQARYQDPPSDGGEQRRRYEVVTADSGDAGVARLQELRDNGRPVALVIADERMAGLSGVELLGRVTELHPSARRALLTTYADTQGAIQAINEAQLDLYLTKPWQATTDLHSPLDDLLATWEAGQQAHERFTVVFGDRWAPRSYQLREFLARHRVPYEFHDTATDEGRAALEDAVGRVKRSQLPVVITSRGERLERPQLEDLAPHLDLHTRPETDYYDLVVVGAGPAGLTASVYGASEGLRTLLIDREAPGGQAGLSARIENYLGFPSGLSGLDLANRAVAQARKFGVEILSPQEATEIRVDHGYKLVTLANGTEVSSHALVLSTGVQWRMLEVDGLSRFTGAGVYYGASMAEARTCRNETVYVVGGANSAGQAALNFAQFAREVVMLVREASLAESMSEYLVEDIEEHDRIRVIAGTQVMGAEGEDRLQRLVLRKEATGETWTVDATSLYVMIGAEPRTDWLRNVFARDAQGFVLTGPDLPRLDDRRGVEGWPLDRDPWLLETCVPGAFAAGDVRHGSVKRVASSVGEGAAAIQFVHHYLSQV